jgi:arginine exporter protein ArgO
MVTIGVNGGNAMTPLAQMVFIMVPLTPMTPMVIIGTIVAIGIISPSVSSRQWYHCGR